MARYRRSRWRQYVAVSVVLLLAVLRWWSERQAEPLPRGGAVAGQLPPGIHNVERVVDGDTLILSTRRVRVRLQGVDTPETVREFTPVEPWGPEASAFTKAFVDDAHGKLRVEIDGEPLDQYGRHLAFLWHGDRLLNEELVRRGLARATLQYDFSEGKKERLRRAQHDAKRARAGIWSQ